MGMISEAVRHLIAAGVSGESLIQAIADMEATAAVETISAGARWRERRSQNNDAVWVYVMAVDHQNGPPLVKIGISQSPEERMATLARDHRRSLSLAATFGPFQRRRALDIERSVHFALFDLNESGEWFWCSVSMAEKTIGRFAFGEDLQ